MKLAYVVCFAGVTPDLHKRNGIVRVPGKGGSEGPGSEKRSLVLTWVTEGIVLRGQILMYT